MWCRRQIADYAQDTGYLNMAKTASPSSGSSNRSIVPGKMKSSQLLLQQQLHASSSSASTAIASLPQCKVKRNYACAKCNYYTQNPRSFLHHQKNVHAERIKVYECSHCLYASKHSQKLQRHVKMVHTGNRKNAKAAAQLDATKTTPLVPPVRIRVRFEKHAARPLAELVTASPEDGGASHKTKEAESFEPEEDMEEDREDEEEGEEEEAEEEEEEEEAEEEEEEEAAEDANNDVDESGGSADEASPADHLNAVESSRQQKKQIKLEKQSSTFIRCSVCPYGSHSQTLVNKHEKTAHLKKKFFRCMKCNYVTHMRARYTKHVKYHTMPMIKCADCDFQTPYKWNLDRHNRNHSATSPGTYRCSHCSFSADIKQSLTVHETNHHVPPVGGVFPSPDANRRIRRYRVGASDAPGSAVDGTEIVTYETTTDVGVVEIMTETKSASATSPTKVVVTETRNNLNSSNTDVTTFAEAVVKSDAAVAKKALPPRRPLPKLIPIGGTRGGASPQAGGEHATTPSVAAVAATAAAAAAASAASVAATEDDNDYYGAGQSVLSDFASLIDDQDAAVTNRLFVDTSEDRSQRGGSSRSSASPKSKTASFFDKLKAKVDETADLTCPVCRYESKCLSEFMRHQRVHGDDDEAAAAAAAANNRSEDASRSSPPPPPPPVTAAELKSTRCQRCRKRCKTSAELVTHLATCRGSSAAVARNPSPPSAAVVEPNDDSETGQQHPMENRIFVWNTAAIPASRDEIDDGGDRDQHHSEVPEIESLTPAEENPTEDENFQTFADSLQQQSPQQQQQHLARKEGKIYKTVFKCPHCTFWAATASRFHVHIVGHLNRKPFECSCCAYRSNWRWDITKHIRLKTAKRNDGEDTASNSHHGAKVLMTDETGRRNYSKYNRYLTVMEMDYVDGADSKVAGGDFEDGKPVAFKQVVGGGPVRKQRRSAGTALPGKKTAAVKQQQQQTPSTGRLQQPPTTGGGPAKKFKAAAGWKPPQPREQSAQHGGEQVKKSAAETMSTPKPSPPPPLTAASGGDNRSKTVWKCKKCLFRDCDRLTVLNHVRAHYRRGEFSGPENSKQKTSDVTQNQKNTEKENTSEPKEPIEDNTPSAAERRKMKTPTTGTTSEKTLLLSAKHKSLPPYDDENYLSCPLCDVAATTSSQLKEHMHCAHISEEIKYRCEYCPFWSEEKQAMLDHMMFSHELSESGKTTNSYRNETWNGLSPNYNYDESREDGSAENGDFDEKGPPFCDDDDDRGAGLATAQDSAADEESVDAADENMVVIETVEYEPNIEEITINAPRKKNPPNGGAAGDDGLKPDGRIIVVFGEPAAANGEIAKVVNVETSRERQTLECANCLYFSTDREDMTAHRQLHVKRGALYNCAQCVFNVSRADVLYHHYRTGHGVEEPELRYPEDSVVRAGHKDMVAKNQSKERPDDKPQQPGDVQDPAASGPPLVWNYRRQNEPPFTKVFKCRYCPHTNRRRHNTVEHERMHSDHPEHLIHRAQQQRSSAGSPTPPSPMHPCKRCTYVCNNAGVLASHVKVHSVGYGAGTVGFYDTEIVDTMQILALEYAMDLERRLLLDDGERLRSAPPGSTADDAAAATGHPQPHECNKYSELDEPELKFCPRCPARFFFLSDLRCHARFHDMRSGRHACDRCSFATRTAEHADSHKTVHGAEYARRTAELIAGYRVGEQYPQPAEYPAVEPSPGPRECGSPPLVRSPVYEIVETSAADDDSEPQRRPIGTKRPHSETDVATVHPERRPEGGSETDAKRVRRSTSSVGDAVEATPSTAAASLPPPLIGLSVATADPPTTRAVGVADVETPIAPNAADGAAVKSANNNTVVAVKQFQCDKCPGRFFKATALQYHETLHGGSGVHRCRVCDYAVSMYGNLIRHESVHRDLPPREKTKTSSNPAKTKCAGTVSSSSSSSSPIVDDDGSPTKPEDDAPAAALQNGPPFFYPTTVKNGVARPKRYRCPKCPSAFDKRSQYTVHITLHGAGDKYQCDKCDYSVRYTANYVQHQRKHARDAELRRNHEQGGASTLQPDGDGNVEPRDTVFRNEISDRQTAYELNAAYGATGLQTPNGSGGGGDDDPLLSSFRCDYCPFECSDRESLDQHAVHHRKEDPSGGCAWKRSCRFCTYRTQSDADMAEHTRGHFYRSTGAVRTKDDGRAAVIGPADHVEFHGKRVQMNGRGKGAADGDDDADVGGEPFFVFRDRGGGDARRFSPDGRTPPVLIDFNDNRTSGECDGEAVDSALSEKSLMRLQQQQPAMVRYVNGRKRLEFLNGGGPKSFRECGGDKKKKNSKKH